MQLIEVTNSRTEKDFLNINALMQTGNPYYIRPMDHEVKAVFDTQKNKYFAYGSAKRWILRTSEGKLIGRIAAFTNTRYKNKGTDFATGGIGFFDCINDQASADKLFTTAANWLQQQGMAAMDGPINFGDRDKWWGLMVEGFDAEPVYGMSYNPPYYEALFTRFGFRNYYNQYFYTMEVNEPFPAKIMERHARFASKPDYTARHLEKNKLEQYAVDFATVYNAAWAQHGENKAITVPQILAIFKEMKPILDERTIWFAYYKNEPIAMFVNIPDINQYFKYFDGKLGWLQKLQLLWLKQRGMCKKLTGLAFGVVPKYQSLGIDSFIIGECGNMIQNKGWYNSYEMGWAGEWNPKMINIYKHLGAQMSRRLVTYRYIFDTVANPFERHPVMEYKQIDAAGS